VLTHTMPPPPPGETVAPGLVSGLGVAAFVAVSFATFFVAGVAVGAGLVGAGLLDLNNPPNNFFGEADAAGEGLAAASAAFLRVRCSAAGEAVGDAAAGLASVAAFLRVRRSGVAEAEDPAEAAGLASVAAFLRVLCAVAEGEVPVSAGLAAVVASVFLGLRCFAGDSPGEGLGVSLCANVAPAKASVQRTTRYFKFMAQSNERARRPSIHFMEKGHEW
jgi:hypothetical protein